MEKNIETRCELIPSKGITRRRARLIGLGITLMSALAFTGCPKPNQPQQAEQGIEQQEKDKEEQQHRTGGVYIFPRTYAPGSTYQPSNSAVSGKSGTSTYTAPHTTGTTRSGFGGIGAGRVGAT